MIIEQASHKIIPGNKSNASPRYIVSLDTETLPNDPSPNGRTRTHRFRLGVAISGRLEGGKITRRHIAKFSSEHTFWRYLYSLTGPRHTTWLVAHNALFDLVVAGFPERFANGEMAIDWPRQKRININNGNNRPANNAFCVIESPPTIIACRVAETQGRLVIVDSLNWFQAPLSVLGESCGIQKKPMPQFDESDETWFNYCQTDSEIVFETFVGLIKWVSDNDMGMFRYTGPGQAFAAYRHRFMAHRIFTHDNADVKKLERASYFGGRTEVFKMGQIDETVYQLDINSLFPSVMRDNEYPCVLDKYELLTEYTDKLPDIDYSKSIMEVTLDTNNAIFPYRRDKIILYPTGVFNTVLCGHELKYARNKGYIRMGRSWATYRAACLFKLWVNTLWDMRQGYRASGEKLYDSFTKSLLNSLYGKFAQLAPAWINRPDILSNLPWTTWTEYNAATLETRQMRSVGWLAQEQIEREEMASTFPAISAFVTAAARMRMNGLRLTAGLDNVYYQGVDGLVVNQLGYDRLIAADEVVESQLGKLRLLLATNNGEILGCSDYRLGQKVVIAGRAKVYEDIEAGQLMQRKFSTTSQLFTVGCGAQIEEYKDTWTRADVYKKGIVQSDGWVRPYWLNNETVPPGDNSDGKVSS